jgi:hypothetical protein
MLKGKHCNSKSIKDMKLNQFAIPQDDGCFKEGSLISGCNALMTSMGENKADADGASLAQLAKRKRIKGNTTSSKKRKCGDSITSAAATNVPFAALLHLDRLRAELNFCDGGTQQSDGDAHAAVAGAFLWLRAEPFLPLPDDALPLAEQSLETVERAFPSLHTCLLANVVAFSDLLLLGGASRFAARGSFPPVYLSCAINFERDEAPLHTLLSCEIAILEHQDQCAAEATEHAEVRFALDPHDGCNWLAFFKRRFNLERKWEVWQGDTFVENMRVKPKLTKGFTVLPVFGLRGCALGAFAGLAVSVERGAGVVVVYRRAPPDAEPFGMWLGFVVLRGALFIVDLQNTLVSHSLPEAVAALEWEEQPQEEVFFAFLI